MGWTAVLPGFIPRVLSDPAVGLFRADERVFDAMLDGWRAQRDRQCPAELPHRLHYRQQRRAGPALLLIRCMAT